MSHELALSHALPGTGPAANFAGDWKNELTSTMTLVQTNDVVTGLYESAVSGSDTTTKGDLQGYVDGSVVSFTVHWRDFQAITAWVGRLATVGGVDTITTLWQMTKQVAPGDEWASINAGADTFTRV